MAQTIVAAAAITATSSAVALREAGTNWTAAFIPFAVPAALRPALRQGRAGVLQGNWDALSSLRSLPVQNRTPRPLSTLWSPVFSGEQDVAAPKERDVGQKLRLDGQAASFRCLIALPR